MTQQNALSEIAGVLKAAKRVLVVSHYNPDPDAFGSACALSLTLRANGTICACLNESGQIPRLGWIPGANEIVSEYPAGAWDVIVACDCGDGKRVGDRLKEKVLAHSCLVNLDHHASNDFFGKWNYVAPNASSTSEIVADLIEEMGLQISARVATCLYAGLSGDTGSFKYSSTSAKALGLAQKLVLAGAKPAEIAEELYAKNSIAALKLQALAIAKLKLHANSRISWVVVTNEMLRETGAEKEDADVLVDIIRDLDGVVASALLKQDFGFWRVSLRSKSPSVDLSLVAGGFGGGGHKAAAGFRWRNSLEELEPLLLARLTECLATKNES